MNIYEYAKYNGLSMSDLGKRGGNKSGRSRKLKRKHKRAFDALQQSGGDWWNK